MKEPTPAAGGAKAKKRKSPLLLILLALPVLLLAAGAGAYVLVPGLAAKVTAMLPGHAAPATPAVAANRPTFVDLPEMAVTLPNGGHARQLRIRMSLELTQGPGAVPPTEVLSPRLYDALLTYLRTLRDGELEGGLAIDRLRADLYRRASLVFGDGAVKDVLITSLVMG